MSQELLTRQKLYNLVWSQSMLSLSKKYDISDVGLRKICLKLNIPIPKVGHWQKLQFGKKVIKVPLPNNYSGKEQVSLELRDPNSPVNPRGQSPLSILAATIEKNISTGLTVPERLTNPEKLI